MTGGQEKQIPRRAINTAPPDTTGLKTDDFVEIVEGLSEGDRIILSDISAIEDLDELVLK